MPPSQGNGDADAMYGGEEEIQVNDTEREEIIVLLRKSIAEDPNPRLASLSFLGRSFSPIDILHEVEARTEFGERYGTYFVDKAHKYQKPLAYFLLRNVDPVAEPDRARRR